jgi:hypothetical protein
MTFCTDVRTISDAGETLVLLSATANTAKRASVLRLPEAIQAG